ncbi:dihydrofolate reductase family protein [Nonomuraea dietziae]|uniref:Riboflavin biosynthesis protein RibD n=1 Tax=Nonomuraea dietziae TaxID=65515 RepID=A0A7W5VHP8_9ACTN|nr:dihydrofolate reductase family protein [Nonomuraea dietziae]MBB3733820.1 diaminohydroxyphosphoribosylaminopyrimidine deaminase/5-amino-6-(5-phosphoribosylamino)uracil reductase [Nonomuraea dietziae]
MASLIELAAMRRAIMLSAFGLGATSPNPPVGCVILDANGRVAGEGYHERKGLAHAEGNALRAAGTAARGGTAVVTLEPCNHVGRAPACRQLLLDAQVARVVVALADPTSRGRGGIAELRAAGVSVESDVLVDEALLVLGAWRHSLRMQRPTLTWVYEVARGRIRGAVDRISAAEELLWEADAVLAADGNHLGEAVVGRHGYGMLALPRRWDGRDPAELAQTLARGGVRHLLLDGGLELAEPFIKAGLVDQIVVFVADPAGLPEPVLPGGFQMVEVSRKGDHVQVCARRGQLVAGDSTH